MARVHIERDGAVCTLRYDNGPGNVLTVAGLVALRRAMRDADGDPSVQVVVLAGRADGFVGPLDPVEALAMAAAAPRFPRGVDWVVARLAPWIAWALQAAWGLPDAPRWHAHTGYLHHLALFDAVENARVITVAAIGGHCVGGGMELALCADLRVACDSELVLAQPEVLAGVVPGFGATQRLARAVGSARALALQLTGDPVAAHEAQAMGLVHRVFPAAGFDDGVRDLTQRLSRRAPAAVRGIKRACRGAPDHRLAAGLALERVEAMRAWHAPEAEVGLRRLSALLQEARATEGADARLLLHRLEGG